MQTTLLGLAIAIILALVSALVAPLVVDWNHYRANVEEEASRLTGLDVRVNGTIDARILPSPVITLRDVEVGDAGQPLLRAGTLKLELGLGALLRGEVRATEVSLIAPQISLGLDRSGAIGWPKPSPSFRPVSLSISRFNVEDGRVVLTDARSGARIVLEKFWFAGDIRSLLGPFKGEGAFVVDDELYGFRLAGSHVDDAGMIKVRLGVDPSDQPLTTDVEGTLAFTQGIPQFEGTLAVARPVGATLANGERVMSEPWHAGGTIKATPAAVSVRDVAFQYGPEERALNLTGSAELTFGEHPHFDGAITALQIDVDRALAAPDVTHQPPLVAVRSFLQAFVAAARLPVPGQIHVGVDALTVGGTTIQSLRGDVQFDRAGWNLNAFEFRAPGLTQVNLGGRLTDTPHGFAFSGPGTLESTDADMLVAWLKGRSELPSGQAKRLSARGDVTIASDRIAVEHLAAALDQENVEGRLAYTWPIADRPAALDADLHAAELDLDALTNFARTAVGSDGFVLPQQGELALDIGTVTFAGMDARVVKAQIKFDSGKLHIDRLSIGDLRGATLDISGRIDELSSRPRGQVTLTLDARALDGLSGIAARFAPRLADALHRLADRLAPAQVHAVLTVDRAATAGSTAKLHIDGSLAAMRVAIDGEASGEPTQLGDAVLRLDSRLDADDATALVGLLGLDRVIAVDQLPGRITLAAAGPLNGDLHVDGQIAASGLDATVQGSVRLNGERAPTGALRLQVSAGDLRPLQQLMTGQPGSAVPVSGRAALAVDGTALSFTDIAVLVGKSSVHGRLAVSLASRIGIDGDIEADDVDAASATALLLGLPRNPADGGASWSSAPMAAGAFTALSGALTFKLDHAVFTPGLTVNELTGIAHFRPSEVALDGLDGNLAAGHVTGALLVRRDQNGLAAHARVALAGADAAIIAGPAMNIADGRLTMMLQCDGAGGSPFELIGSLHGDGTMTLADAHFAGLDAAAFAAAIQAADESASIDMANIQAVVSAAMANGRLAVPQGHADATIALGRLNLTHVILPAQDGTELSLDGAIDLAGSAIDLRMTLSEPPPPSALIRTRPEILVTVKGPLAAPQRAVDVSALTSWLTLRAAELQTRRLESMEADRHDAAIAPVTRPDSPAVRVIPSGTVVESSIPSSLAAPVPGARGVERLQPPTLPPATPDQSRSGGTVAAPKPIPMTAPMVIRPALQPSGTPPSAPPPSAPPPPASSSASPSAHSVLDFLFRSH